MNISVVTHENSLRYSRQCAPKHLKMTFSGSRITPIAPAASDYLLEAYNNLSGVSHLGTLLALRFPESEKMEREKSQ